MRQGPLLIALHRVLALFPHDFPRGFVGVDRAQEPEGLGKFGEECVLGDHSIVEGGVDFDPVVDEVLGVIESVLE